MRSSHARGSRWALVRPSEPRRRVSARDGCERFARSPREGARGGDAGSNGKRPGPATARLEDDQPDAVEQDARLRRLFVELDARGVARAPRRTQAAKTALCSVESLDRLFFGVFGRSYTKWIRRWRVEFAATARNAGAKEDVAAKEAGFRCASEFISAHISEFGVTPSGLRPRRLQRARSISESHETGLPAAMGQRRTGRAIVHR